MGSRGATHHNIAEGNRYPGSDLYDVLLARCQRAEAENERLRAAVLAYDDAIRDIAKLGKQWVRDDDKLDDLYAEMVTAAGRDIDS